MALIVIDIQEVFITRFNSWTRYMAATGQQRQNRWNRKGWMKLVFEILKQQTQRAQVRQGITLKQWYTERRDDPGARIRHAVACCWAYAAYVRRRQRAIEEQRAAKQLRIVRARQRICRKVLGAYRKKKLVDAMENRVRQREGKVAASTRSVRDLYRINYAETKFRSKPSIGKVELYKLHRWPHRDKITDVVVSGLCLLCENQGGSGPYGSRT